MTGQSQGSGAALGATRIAPNYAPELPLLATVATGVVSTFPDGPYKPPGPTSIGSPIYVMLQTIGGALPDESPSVDSLVTEKGRALLQAARTGCTPEMRAVAVREGIKADDVFVEPLEKIEARLTAVTNMTSVRMPVPILVGTGLSDALLSPQRQYAAAMALCAAGSQLTWKTYSGVTHNGGVNVSFPDALDFFRKIMAGTTVESNCDALAEPGNPDAPAPGISFND